MGNPTIEMAADASTLGFVRGGGGVGGASAMDNDSIHYTNIYKSQLLDCLWQPDKEVLRPGSNVELYMCRT